MSPAPSSTPRTQLKTAWCVSRSSSRRCSRNRRVVRRHLLLQYRESRAAQRSAARHAIPRRCRCPRRPQSSKQRKYTPGAMLGRPIFSRRTSHRSFPQNLSKHFRQHLVDRLIVGVACERSCWCVMNSSSCSPSRHAHCHTAFVHHEDLRRSLIRCSVSTKHQTRQPRLVPIRISPRGC